MPSTTAGFSRDVRLITPVFVRPRDLAGGRDQGNPEPYLDPPSPSRPPPSTQACSPGASPPASFSWELSPDNPRTPDCTNWTTIDDFRELFRDEGILLPSGGGDRVKEAKSRWRDHLDVKLDYSCYTLERLQEMSDASDLGLSHLKKQHLVAALKGVDKARQDVRADGLMSEQLVDELIGTNERIIRSIQSQKSTESTQVGHVPRAWRVEVAWEDQTASTYWIPLAGPAVDEQKDITVAISVSPIDKSGQVYNVQIALGDASDSEFKPKHTIQITSYFSLRAQDVSVNVSVEDFPEGVYTLYSNTPAFTENFLQPSPTDQQAKSVGVQKEYKVRKSARRRGRSRHGSEQHHDEGSDVVELPRFFTKTVPFIFPIARPVLRRGPS